MARKSARQEWDEIKAEMRARVDPRLELLPEGLRRLVRSASCYEFANSGQSEGTYDCEDLVTACETLAALNQPPLAALEHPEAQVRRAARLLLRYFPWPTAIPVLLRQFEEMPEERESLFDTIFWIENPQLNAQMVEWMTSHPDADFRADAALALILVAQASQDQSLAEPFLAVLQNEAEEDRIRAHVIEGLAYILSRSICRPPQPLDKSERYKDRRSRFWRTCTEAILPYLSHPNPRYRWEAAFALGQARCRKALPQLREMAAHDEGLSDGSTGLPVAAEAADAIKWIEARR